MQNLVQRPLRYAFFNDSTKIRILDGLVNLRLVISFSLTTLILNLTLGL
jgi:hypothetical protein